jgi:hypothetical protein
MVRIFLGRAMKYEVYAKRCPRVERAAKMGLGAVFICVKESYDCRRRREGISA